MARNYNYKRIGAAIGLTVLALSCGINVLLPVGEGGPSAPEPDRSGPIAEPGESGESGQPHFHCAPVNTSGIYATMRLHGWLDERNLNDLYPLHLRTSGPRGEQLPYLVDGQQADPINTEPELRQYDVVPGGTLICVEQPRLTPPPGGTPTGFKR